jgi:hypothetical protein
MGVAKAVDEAVAQKETVDKVAAAQKAKADKVAAAQKAKADKVASDKVAADKAAAQKADNTLAEHQVARCVEHSIYSTLLLRWCAPPLFLRLLSPFTVHRSTLNIPSVCHAMACVQGNLCGRDDHD